MNGDTHGDDMMTDTSYGASSDTYGTDTSTTRRQQGNPDRQQGMTEDEEMDDLEDL